MDNLLKSNIEIHNKIAKKYHNKHSEIFNDIEQNRLKKELEKAIANISTSTNINNRTAIDYGCGSGNLTAHLLDLDLNVISTDVSNEFLNLINKQFQTNPKSSTFLLNGSDVKEFDTDTIDFIGIYSVLHHIPDYLFTLKDIARIVKPGGVIFIDHEANPDYWENKSKILNFYKKYENNSFAKKIKNLGNPKWYIKKYNKLKDPRWQEEGDIHVWEDDHIEWNKIENVLDNANFELLYFNDYLHFNSIYNLEDYMKTSLTLADCRTSVFRKKSSN